MSSTWTLVNLGDRKYRLETAAGRLIGWIHGHAIGLSGLRDDVEALKWAPALRRVLDDALRREYPGRYRPVGEIADLRLVHDGAYEWMAAGDIPVGRLHRPSSRRSDGCLAVEFVLPSYASEAVTIACAEMLATMLYDGILARSLGCDGGKAPSRRVAEPSRRVHVEEQIPRRFAPRDDRVGRSSIPALLGMTEWADPPSLRSSGGQGKAGRHGRTPVSTRGFD